MNNRFTGPVSKMSVSMNSPIRYTINLGSHTISANPLIGKEIQMFYSGKIQCVDCGTWINKSYGQGFCYPCFRDSPMNSECIIRPELCRAHLGEGRDPQWEKEHHLRPHFVYLALSDKVKVGVTREDQIPVRWIDQGAYKAVCLAKTRDRYHAGLLEVHLKSHFTDKTNWRNMLKGIVDDQTDLLEIYDRTLPLLSECHDQWIPGERTLYTLEFPVLEYPRKITSLNFDKNPLISGTLTGIKGQYLLLDGDRVINLRKYSGYEVTFSF